MKTIIYVLIALLIITPVMATENVIIKTNINMTYDENTSTLRIMGENLNWAKTLCVFNCTNSTWTNNLELLMLREMGNLSDITNLFDKLDVCLNQMNYTDKYLKVMQVNSNVANELLMCQENLSYADNYTQCENTLAQKNTIISNKDSEKDAAVKTIQDEYDALKKQRDWIGLFAVVAGAAAIIMFTRNKVSIFGKREERTRLPERFPV